MRSQHLYSAKPPSPLAEEALLAALSASDDTSLDAYAPTLRQHQEWVVRRLATLSSPAAYRVLATVATIRVCPPRTYALSPLTDRPKEEPPAPRRPRMVRADPRRITAVAENPKLAGSACWKRYDLYLVGDTLDQAVAKGVTRADIRYDVKRGFLQLALR